MHILVTGGAGFIGFHTAWRLVTMGHRVTIIDNLNDYYDIKLKQARLDDLGFSQESSNQASLQISGKTADLFFAKLDICSIEKLTAFFDNQKFDAVCHLAAQAGVRSSSLDPRRYVESNVVGFFNVLECCREFQIKNLCFASSSSVYGLNAKYPYSTQDGVDHPISLYAATKKSNELMAHTYSYLYDIHITGLRFFTVYGPWGRPDMAVWRFVEAAFSGDTIEIFNDGENRRDYTFIDDIVTGVVKVIEKPAQSDKEWSASSPNANSSQAAYKIYNIGNNKSVSMGDLIHVVEEVVGKKLATKIGARNANEVASTQADIDDLIQAVGYTPAIELKEGVSKFFIWYQKYVKKYVFS